MPLGGDVIIVSLRGPSVGKQIVDVWDATTGTRIIHVESTINATNTANATAGTTGFPRGLANVGKLAWVRAYSEVSSYDGTAMPDDYNAPAGDLIDFRYEGNVSGTILGKAASLSPAASAGDFSTTPNHKPVIYATAAISAGAASTLTAKAVTFGEPLTVAFLWQQLSGPSKLIFDSHRGSAVTVQGVVEGKYTLRLSAESASGTVTKDLTVTAENRDYDGVPVFPSLTTRDYPMKFGVGDVPGATQVRATVKKPDGRDLPPITCTSSPCSLQVDPQQRDHTIKLEYLAADGKVLRTGSYVPVGVKQAGVPVKYGVYNRMGIMNYVAYRTSQGAYLDQLLRFQAARYDVFYGGESPVPYAPDPGVISLSYIDLVAIYVNNIYKLKEIAARRANNFTYEDMLLHMDANYDFVTRDNASRDRYIWNTVSRFDAGESWNDSQSWQSGLPANGSATSTRGVFTWTADGGFVDRTTASYNATAADVPISEELYLGYMEPFDEINFVLSTGRTGGSAEAKYWNGTTWTNLTLRSDTTNGLRQSGKVLFNPPTSWRETTVNGGPNAKWWVKFVVTGASVAPVASTIRGDDWLAVGYTTTARAWGWRGWAASSPTRIPGPPGYEYDPTPPAGASARFRYQARALGLWAADHFFGNPTNFQNGRRTWSKYIVDAVTPNVVGGNYSGILFDDGLASPSNISNPSSWQSHTDAAGRNYKQALYDVYGDARKYFREIVPNGKTCVNSDDLNQAKKGDCYLVELVDEVWKGGACSYPQYCVAKYDDIAPGPGNPNNTRGLFSIWDTRGSDFNPGTGWIPWDQGNRAPMTALASYYIVANPNTRFVYNVSGWTYGLSDEYLYIDAKETGTLTAELTTDTTSATKTLAGAGVDFPAGTSNVKIGTTGEFLTVTKSGNNLTTAEAVNNTYPIGTKVWLVKTGRLAKDPLPPLDQIVRYSNWFPAVGIDIGVPDATGHKGGVRDFTWKLPAVTGNKNGWHRRDFTNAVVVHSNGYDAAANWINSYGNSIPLGGTYYPLQSNGKTGDAVTSIRLRTGEGVVLMKKPVQ
jgi:hypothetical protein